MRTARACLLTTLLVLAAAAPAQATLSPTDPTTGRGHFTANSVYPPDGPFLTADSFTVICDASTMSQTYTKAGAGIFTALSLSACTTIFGIGCTATLDNTTLNDATTAGQTYVHTGGGAGTATLGANATVTVNFTCIGVTCTYNFDTTNTAKVITGDPAVYFFDHTNVTTASGGDCTNGTFTGVWTITTVDGGTGTPTPDDTGFTLS